MNPHVKYENLFYFLNFLTLPLNWGLFSIYLREGIWEKGKRKDLSIEYSKGKDTSISMVVQK